jgi:hypothetical protein
MSLYRLYIDEVGNHDLTHADDFNQRFLSLTGVILESAYTLSVVQPEMDRLKREYFQRDPDLPVIFHRKEMVNKCHPFEALRDPSVQARFDLDLLLALSQWDYRVITVVIDKKAHRDQYQVWHYHPYHYCLAVLLERYILFLHYNNERGDVIRDVFGGQISAILRQSKYHRHWRTGQITGFGKKLLP